MGVVVKKLKNVTATLCTVFMLAACGSKSPEAVTETFLKALMNGNFQEAAMQFANFEDGLLMPFDAFYRTVETFLDHLNPESLVETKIYMEPSLVSASAGEIFQFERIGYFCKDADSTPGKPVFNRTVTLKDSWAKQKN